MVDEPVHLWQVKHTRHRCWAKQGRIPAWQAGRVAIGTLNPDGTWYVDVVEQLYHPAILVGSEQEAHTVAEQWMRWLGGDWAPVPCDPTGNAKRRMRQGQDSTGSQE